MWLDIILSSIILSAASALQSVVGFGMALFAVPLLLLAGIPLLPAVFLVLTISCLSSLLAVSRLRNELQPRLALQATLSRMIGIIPGYLVALYTVTASPATLKAAMGVVIALGVVGQSRKLFRKRDTISEGKPPSKKIAPYAFLSSGFFAGWLGMGGPPLVFWLLTGSQDARKTRAFLFSVYLLTIPFQLLVMAYHDPTTMMTALPLVAFALPCSLLVTSQFLKLGDRLNVERLQKLSLIVLSLLSAKAFFDWFQAI